jgi:butyryl-CoA dehydrogenase
VELQFERLTEILPTIRARASSLDRSGDWPKEDLADLAGVGATRWFVPGQYGGDGVDPLALHLRYEAIASASLGTALIVSQRDSAIGLISGSDQEDLLARGEFFSTIGIAQLTTSRTGGLLAVKDGDGDGYRLEGVIPWCTGAAKAKFIIAGAVMEDGEQILFSLPTDLPGVIVGRPMELVALRSSWTSQVELKSVRLSKRQILRGPMAKVLAGGGTKGIPLGQTFLAFGLCRGAIGLMGEDSSERAKSLVARFSEQLAELRGEVLEICRTGDDAGEGPRIRAACNDLALRITQAAVALNKGSALLLDHPAQRLAREAMFFLVWSCPDPVIDCTVNVLSEKK